MADSVNLQKSYAALNEKLAELFDESGVRRSFTIPYIDGQMTDEHIQAVGQASQQAGGLTNNLVTTAHHSSGRGWGTGDGHTVGHPADKLRNTIIPKDDEHAIAAIAAAQKHLDNLAKLLGDDDPTIQTANGQLALVKKTDGAGMNLLDFGVMMTQIMFKAMQKVAQMHSGTKDGGHAPQLRAPGKGQAQQQPDQSQQAPPEGGQAQPEAGAPEAAPEAQPAPEAAPEAPQAQG